MSLNRYPNYKPSGLAWAPEIPVSWQEKKLGYIVLFTHGKAHEPYIDESGQHICVNSRFVSTNGLRVKYCTENHTPAAKFDLLMVMSDLPNGRALARAFHVTDGRSYAVNQRVCRITAMSANPRFLYYILDRNPDLLKKDDGANQTHLSSSDFQKLRLFLPSNSEQTQIARFLDHETAKIDTLIHEQKHLIELLKEKRQAVISHAVTKGLDADVPMKDSGVEWLGEVPAHWEVRKLSTITDKITNGYVGPTRGLFVDEGVSYLQSLHIKNNEILFKQPYFVSLEWSNAHSKSILREGDVLIVQTGDIGQSAVVTKKFAGSNCHALIVVSSVRSVLDGNYLSWVLNSPYGKNTLLSIQTGALHPHLNCGYVKDVWIPLPPTEEQQQIVNHLERELTSFQALTEQATLVAKILQERRSALISAAVTGKIDVRDWQPPANESAFDEEVRQAGMEVES